MVKRTNRDRPVDEFASPDASTVEHIRKHLPNQPSPNLQAVRRAKVLDQERAFLADTSGIVEPPEREALIDALAFAAEFIREHIVIGVKA